MAKTPRMTDEQRLKALQTKIGKKTDITALQKTIIAARSQLAKLRGR